MRIKKESLAHSYDDDTETDSDSDEVPLRFMKLEGDEPTEDDRRLITCEISPPASISSVSISSPTVIAPWKPPAMLDYCDQEASRIPDAVPAPVTSLVPLDQSDDGARKRTVDVNTENCGAAENVLNESSDCVKTNELEVNEQLDRLSAATSNGNDCAQTIDVKKVIPSPDANDSKAYHVPSILKGIDLSLPYIEPASKKRKIQYSLHQKVDVLNQLDKKTVTPSILYKT